MQIFNNGIKAYQLDISDKLNSAKVESYNDLFEVLLGKKDAESLSVSKTILKAINNSENNILDQDKLMYICIKLEIMANIEGLKKDSQLRQVIQFEMLADKFNKGSNDKKGIIETLLVDFFSYLPAKDAGASEKKLWARIVKALDGLSKDLP